MVKPDEIFAGRDNIIINDSMGPAMGPNVIVVVSLGNVLHVGSKFCLYEFTELNFLSVGSQLPPRKLNILID